MAPSYASGVGSKPLIGETIGALLERVAQELPEHPALISRHQGVRLTYAELDAQADRLALALMAAGLDVGDRVGIWSPNCAEWALTQFATAKAGIVLVNINPAYRPTELAYALKQSGCKLLVSAQSFKTSDYVAMVDEVRDDLPALERVVFLDTPDWEELLALGDGADVEALRNRSAGLQFDDPINIQYTSGTTGFPKGATLSHHNILNNGFFVGELCGYTHEDRVCIPVPLYHCFGMVMGNLGCVTHGATMVYPSGGFEPGATLDAVQAERCTSLYGVPTMFIAELGHPDFASYDLKSLRTGIMAGSPCPVEVMRRVVDEMHMGEVTICYGMTETSPVSTQTTAEDDLEHRVSTVGRVHPHLEVKLVDPATNAVVERGQPGELLTRGYSVMLGYWEDPDRTAEAIDPAGWMHTGDLATMDAEGYLNIVGRSKDMVIRGGRERVPARGRGVPLRASRGARRRGLRRPGRALRRGAVRVDPGQAGPERDGGGDPRVLQGPHRALQGAALRPGRRGVPDDRHRQGAEVQDARDGVDGARPPRSPSRREAVHDDARPVAVGRRAMPPALRAGEREERVGRRPAGIGEPDLAGRRDEPRQELEQHRHVATLVQDVGREDERERPAREQLVGPRPVRAQRVQHDAVARGVVSQQRQRRRRPVGGQDAPPARAATMLGSPRPQPSSTTGTPRSARPSSARASATPLGHSSAQ